MPNVSPRGVFDEWNELISSQPTAVLVCDILLHNQSDIIHLTELSCAQ